MNKKNQPKPPQKKVVPVKKPGWDYQLVFLFAMIAIVSIIRYRLVGVVLERDEGEYAYIGSLLLHGIAPFKNAYSMKLPGTACMYALFMFIFGRSGSGIHLGFLFMNAGTMYFLYAAFKKIFNPFIGLATATMYGFLAIGLPFIGFAAHATHFICFYSAIALLFLAKYMQGGKQKDLFLFGLLLGVTFLMKQQAIFLLLFGIIFLLMYFKTEKKLQARQIIKSVLPFCLGVVVPYFIVFLLILFTGQFHAFWLWTIEYASSYESVKGFHIIGLYFTTSFGAVWVIYGYICILTLAAIVAAIWSPYYTRLQKIFLWTYFITSACAVCTGFYFRPHYYIVLLPAVGILLGILIDFIALQISKRVKKIKLSHVSTGLLSLLVLIMIYNNRNYFFNDSTKKICDTAYWGNPFSIAPAISEYLKTNTTDTDKIAILGSEPEIYFYTDRAAATGYLYTYPLVDKQPYNEIMQQQMIQEIEKNKPAFIVFCNIAYSWIVQEGTPKDIFLWGNKYTTQYYTPVGLIGLYTGGWRAFMGADMNKRPAQPASFILIFKRKPGNG